MSEINTVAFEGNLAADPEKRFTPSGRVLAQFVLINNHRWTGDDGQLRDEKISIPVTVWGKPGEACAAHLTKGQKATVTGRLRTRQYTDRDGQPRTWTEIVADNVSFGPKPRQDDGYPF